MWGAVFASAILDRLLHYCHIAPTSGSSYRIKDELDNLKNGS
ncbi:ATP-binding protein [Chloroflexota bacterium]